MNISESIGSAQTIFPAESRYREAGSAPMDAESSAGFFYLKTIGETMRKIDPESDATDIMKCRLTAKEWNKKGERWYARLEPRFLGKRSIPFANYIWLRHNPVFECIPDGYVIHHLDGDKTNDDASNLVLMLHHLHVIHHWKNLQGKTTSPKYRKIKIIADFDPIEETVKEIPLNREPKVRFNKSRELWYIAIRNLDGSRKYISRNNGNPFKTKEEAQAAKDMIWPIDDQLGL